MDRRREAAVAHEEELLASGSALDQQIRARRAALYTPEGGSSS